METNNFASKVKRILASLNFGIKTLEEAIVILVYSAMVLVVLWIVICRYVLNVRFTIGEELARYLMIYGIFIGTSIGVRRSTHLGVRAFVELLPQWLLKRVDQIQYFFTAVLFFILFILSLNMTVQYHSTGQLSTMMRLPMYLVYSALPVSLFFSVIHAVQNFYTHLTTNKQVK